MIRKFKAFALALVAVFALGAMFTSLAGAHTPAQFTSEGSVITAEQEGTNVFTSTGVEVTCSEAKFTATGVAASSESIAAKASYGGCFFGGIEAKITGFGNVGEAGKCWYVLKANGGAELKCNGGDVTVEAATCTVHIPEQAFAAGVAYTNLAGTPDEVTIGFNINEITATHTDGFLCPLTGSGDSKNNQIQGAIIAESETTLGVQKNLTWDATIP